MSVVDVDAVLRVRYLHDLKKPDFDRFERAAIIRGILDDEGLSIRKFAEKYGVNRSTVEDWLLFNNITPEKFEQLKGKGLTASAIYRELRNSKASCGAELSEIDTWAADVKRRAKSYCKTKELSVRTLVLLDEAADAMNNLASEMRRAHKKGGQQ